MPACFSWLHLSADSKYPEIERWITLYNLAASHSVNCLFENNSLSGKGIRFIRLGVYKIANREALKTRFHKVYPNFREELAIIFRSWPKSYGRRAVTLNETMEWIKEYVSLDALPYAKKSTSYLRHKTHYWDTRV